MDELADLFEGFGGYKEDVIEFGLGGLSVVGGSLAGSYIDGQLQSMAMTQSLPDWARSLINIALGVFSGVMVSKYDRRVGFGFGAGMVAAGITSFAQSRGYLSGLGANTLLLGMGDPSDDLYSRYLGAAPATVETVSGLGTSISPAPITVDQVAGVGDFQHSAAPVSIEQTSGFGAPPMYGAIPNVGAWAGG